jgi:hypothetical protein
MQQLDEKKSVIIQIIYRLKLYNSTIGDYERSVLNADFQYAVKLNNGRITLSQELVHDYEHSPAFVTEDQLKAIAVTFVPSQYMNVVTPVTKASELHHETPSFSERKIEPAKKSGSLKTALVLTTIIVLSIVGYFFFSQINTQEKMLQVEDDKSNIRNNITTYIVAERNEYTYNPLGGIKNLQISVTNNTNYTVDNIRIKVSYIKANGDLWKNEFLDFNLVAPQTKATIKVPDTNRGTSINYEIVSIKSSALGLF